MNAQAKYPPAPEEVRFNPTVLVIGGGASGIASAVKAAEAGLSVVLLEKTAELGGKLAQISSMYQTDLSPSQWLKKSINFLKENKKLAIYTNGSLEKVKGQAGSFTVTLNVSGEKEEIVVGAIVVATGMELSSKMPAPEGADAGRFMSQMELEKKIGEFTGDSKGFVFVVKEDNFLYGMANALKNALKLKNAGHEVYLFYDEMKISEEKMEKLYHQARKEGVYFVRGTQNLKVGQQDNKLVVTTVDPLLPVKLAKELVINFDYFIFNEDLVPAADTKKLAEILKVTRGPGGFFQEDNFHLEPVNSFRPGIYFVGACRMPDFLHNVQEQAGSAVNAIYQLSTADVKSLMDQKPLIDVSKCAYCLTCYRSCPRNAIELLYGIEGAAWDGAPYVHPYACQACGSCVAECPNRAISFPGYTDEDMKKQFSGIGGKS